MPASLLQAPGWTSVLITPMPGGDLTWAQCSFESPAGVILTSP